MKDSLTICVDDHLVASETLQSQQRVGAPGSANDFCSKVNSSSSFPIDIEGGGNNNNGAAGEQEPLIQTAECRICQEEDSVINLEVPCTCSGSLKFAHRKCVQHWCNEKGDTTCEICHQPYQAGYTAPPPLAEETTIDISGPWTIDGNPLDLHDPRRLAMAAAERHLLEADYDEYDDSNASGASFCRSAVLILMALLLMRHALTIGDRDSDDNDVSTFSGLFLLRAAGFLFPCYIMAWAISVLQQRRQRQAAAAALAASDVAFMVQTGQHRGLHVTIATGAAVASVSTSTLGPALSSHQEPFR